MLKDESKGKSVKKTNNSKKNIKNITYYVLAS